MRIKLTAAEAVKMTQFQREVMSAQRHLDEVNDAAQTAISEALERAKKDPKEWVGKQFMLKIEGDDVFIELVPSKKAP